MILQLNVKELNMLKAAMAAQEAKGNMMSDCFYNLYHKLIHLEVKK